jgi:hypothetical protein
MKLRDGSDPPLTGGQKQWPTDSNSRYLADALGRLKARPSLMCVRAGVYSRPVAALSRPWSQPALVQVDALQTNPPRMQPSSLIVFVSCRVRLPV